MKTKEAIEKAIKFGDVFTSMEFLNLVKRGSFIEYDGEGYFHDGEFETDISVWDYDVTEETFSKYPYVCWYNK